MPGTRSRVFGSTTSGRKWSSATCMPRRSASALGDAGAVTSRPVDVERHEAEAFLDLRAHRLRPRLRAEEAHAEAERARGQAGLLDRLRQVERVGGRAAEHRAAEVLEGDELALREAARHRNDRGPDGLRPVVEAEPACEQAVPVSVLHDVARADAARPERPPHYLGPDVKVAACRRRRSACRWSRRRRGCARPRHRTASRPNGYVSRKSAFVVKGRPQIVERADFSRPVRPGGGEHVRSPWSGTRGARRASRGSRGRSS